MSAPGMPIPYFVLENADGFYYQGHGKPWTSKIHYAIPLSEELAQQLVKRYPRAAISRESGYDINPKCTCADVGEPEATKFLADAVRLAARDGMSLETILLHTEKAYHGNKN